ncbi:hypothetical protein B0H13DRAFT_1850919 [Mycena leptocephala]|nr:hypothetical protein B0H13DRAFT_1850919 [Mycena leptocephala]
MRVVGFFPSAPPSSSLNDIHEFSVSLLKTAIGQEDDEDGQKTAVGLERAISKAAAGDLHKYRYIFRHIYLELKSQKVEVVVIARGGLVGIFRLPRRSKMLRLRAIVEEIFDEHDPRARFFMLLYAGKKLLSVDTPTTLQAPDIHLYTQWSSAPLIYIGKYKAGKNRAPGEHPLLDLECRGSNPWVRGNNTQMQNSVTAEDFHCTRAPVYGLRRCTKVNLVPEDLECARAAIEAVEGVL